ncbi:hypothetical protein ACWDE0_23110 [Streptomyces sp. 900105755]
MHVAEPAVDPRVERVDAVVVEKVEVGEHLSDPGDGTCGSLARQGGDSAALDAFVPAVHGGQQVQASQHPLAQGR